jgi:ferredoxin
LAQVRTDDLGAVPLRAAGRAGLKLPYSCRAGVCSTCRARLVKGKITMEHNTALEEWEEKAGTSCAARPGPRASRLRSLTMNSGHVGCAIARARSVTLASARSLNHRQIVARLPR